jgi:hypothetical protein
MTGWVAPLPCGSCGQVDGHDEFCPVIGKSVNASGLSRQPGGAHYLEMAIQPVEFIQRNRIGFIEGNIIKYACRHRLKGGRMDLEKIIHYAQLLLELEYSAHEEKPST